ncbi:MAG: aminotransferase class V-fold PLP-dependent enzyme [Planctomycetota bacterium]
MKDSELAIRNGVPVFEDGPPEWPVTTEAIRHSINAAIDEGSWGQYHGRWTDELEQRLAALFGMPHCLLACSGTVAVEIALRGAGAGQGDEVVLAGYDFPGNFRAIEAVGARPVLIDTVEDGWVMDPELVADGVSENTKAIIVSHLHGQIADIRSIKDRISQIHEGITLIEDACQVPGASVDGILCGSAGDISVLSFGGSKLLSAGRGGAILTGDDSIAQRARIFCTRGNDAFPMSQLQAAALMPQLESLDEQTQKRVEAVELLLRKLSPETRLRPLEQVTSGTVIPAFYKLPWLLETVEGDWSREEFIHAIRAEGLAIDSAFRGFVRRSERRCRKATALTNSSIAADKTLLLHHPVLIHDREAIENVVFAIEKVLNTNPHG